MPQQVWNQQAGRPIDAPNYSDPNQVGSWLNSALTEAAGVDYLSPQSLAQYQGMLAPYFQQQLGNMTQNFSRQFGQQSSRAGMNAGALAAQKGLNPQAFMQSAQRGVSEQMNPGYFSNYNQMLESQLGNLLNTTAQGNQFKANNAFQRGQLLLGQYNKAVDYSLAPKWYDYALGGLFGAGGQIAAAAVGGTGKSPQAGQTP